MTTFLISSAHDFEAAFHGIVSARRDQPASVQDAVRDILARVRRDGDDALFELGERFDRADLKNIGLRVSDGELEAAYSSLAPQLQSALSFARDRIDTYHRRQLPRNESYTDGIGAELGWRWTPLDSVGLYVPGGTASYPSSLLMNAVPAKVAGVRRIVMTVPAPDGAISPAVLGAAHLAGVHEVYRLGGAQAVAAMAFGTASVASVTKIVGPGNAYVAEAKRQVFGVVGIDMVAGPSEVVVVADAKANPGWVALDLLAQAEHDEAAQSILITDSAALAEAVIGEIRERLLTMSRGAIAAKSWERHGAVIQVADLVSEAPLLINALAPEHLELCCEAAETLLQEIRHAGAVFVGHYTPEAIGDYVAGSNHVLPTARAARFSSGLGTLDFMKRTSILKLSPDALRSLSAPAMALAAAEGLDAHRQSVEVRLTRGGLSRNGTD